MSDKERCLCVWLLGSVSRSIEMKTWHRAQHIGGMTGRNFSSQRHDLMQRVVGPAGGGWAGMEVISGVVIKWVMRCYTCCQRLDVEANYWRMYCAVLWGCILDTSDPPPLDVYYYMILSLYINLDTRLHVLFSTCIIIQTGKKSKQGALSSLIGIIYLICLIFWTDANLFCHAPIDPRAAFFM